MYTDFSSKVPLYAQVKSYILEKIESGEWITGFTLPSEQELQDLLEVSRVTIRHAIEELATEGYVCKKQGRGTYVSPPKLSYVLPKLTSFSEDMHNKGFKASSKTLAIHVGTYQPVAQRMALPESTFFLYLRRLRRIDGTAIGIQDGYLNLSLLDYDRICREVSSGKFVELLDLQSLSLYDILEKEYKVTICYADESLEAVSCNKEFAAMLNIPQNNPLLFLDRITYSSNNQPLEYVRMYNRADIYKYSIRLTR